MCWNASVFEFRKYLPRNLLKGVLSAIEAASVY